MYSNTALKSGEVRAHLDPMFENTYFTFFFRFKKNMTFYVFGGVVAHVFSNTVWTPNARKWGARTPQDRRHSRPPSDVFMGVAPPLHPCIIFIYRPISVRCMEFGRWQAPEILDLDGRWIYKHSSQFNFRVTFYYEGHFQNKLLLG